MNPNHVFHAKRSLGQHFLSNANTARWIVGQADITPSDRVIEIGAGRGMMTEILLETGAEIFAIEKDEDLFRYLKRIFKGQQNLEVILGDATEFKWEALSNPSNPAILMGNLPYSISTQILWQLLPRTHLFKRWLFLFQKEVAKRICAEVKTAPYGALSVFVQSVTHPTLLKIFSPSHFIPRPKVDSALVLFKTKALTSSSPMQNGTFIHTVKSAFSHRRKMLRNNLKYLFPPNSEGIESIFKVLNIKGNMRAQDLTVQDYLRLAEKLDSLVSL